jgi:signal transduction histidine kinase
MLVMSTATRCKCGTILKNTVVAYILRTIWRGLGWIWRHILCPVGRGVRTLVCGIPLIWKGVLIVLGLTAVELVWMVISVYDAVAIFLWVLYKLILLPVLFYILICMRHLQRGAQQMAKGDLSHHIDERGLPLALREHAADLNSISVGMNRAVEERTKSERLRTELITNVSHDIKTPLTSIINYVDLLGKEPPANERAAEYLDVLQRQSLRLKKLIEDLVEASRASTGNVAVHMAPVDADILLSQALGEYQERMRAAGLEIIYRAPEEEVLLLADGQLLWRVFDNLLSNALKYAMTGSRVYVDLVRANGDICAVFRNISAQPLHVAPEELLERFVRGDASRHSEGSGLGLSITKSLLELQGGTLDICVDGDLFKVTVCLKTLQ